MSYNRRFTGPVEVELDYPWPPKPAPRELTAQEIWEKKAKEIAERQKVELEYPEINIIQEAFIVDDWVGMTITEEFRTDFMAARIVRGLRRNGGSLGQTSTGGGMDDRLNPELFYHYMIFPISFQWDLFGVKDIRRNCLIYSKAAEDYEAYANRWPEPDEEWFAEKIKPFLQWEYMGGGIFKYTARLMKPYGWAQREAVDGFPGTENSRPPFTPVKDRASFPLHIIRKRIDRYGDEE